MARVGFEKATYHGGLAASADQTNGALLFEEKVIGIRSAGPIGRPMNPLIDISDVVAVEVTSEQVAKSRVGPAIAFGVVGAVAAKATKHEATILLHLRAGDTAYFTIDRQSSTDVRAQLAPWLRDTGIPLGKPPHSPAATPANATDTVEMLATLKAQGVLTQAEFLELASRAVAPN
jgi:hypothetical protein